MSDVKREVSSILKELQVQEGSERSEYLKEAIVIVYENPNAPHQVMVKVYGIIGARHDCDAKYIMVQISKEIERVWKQTNQATLEKYFGRTTSKQFCPPKVIAFIAALSDYLHVQEEQNASRKMLMEILQQIGIHSCLKGYRYICDATLLLYSEEEAFENSMNELYMKLVSRYDTSIEAIERCIRNAIAMAYKKSGQKVMKSYFGYIAPRNGGNITNGQLLHAMAEYLHTHIS